MRIDAPNGSETAFGGAPEPIKKPVRKVPIKKPKITQEPIIEQIQEPTQELVKKTVRKVPVKNPTKKQETPAETPESITLPAKRGRKPKSQIEEESKVIVKKVIRKKVPADVIY
jgi:hypothetical protein